MSCKYTYDNYTVTLDFKNDFCLSITASDLISGDIFINEAVELTKIKKDTVVAALTRKNQKNLLCKFNLVDVEPKKLIMAFEISFDFLPPFAEYITLDQVQKKGTGLNKVESAELRSDIEELEKLLGSISCKESNFAKESSGTYSVRGEVFSNQFERGSYLFEMTGYFLCSAGVITKHQVVFTLQTEWDKFEMQLCLHTNGGYGHPFSIRKDVILGSKGTLRLGVEHKQGQTFNIYNGVVSICPMIKVS